MKKRSAILVALCLSMWVTGCTKAGVAPAAPAAPEANTSAEVSTAPEDEIPEGEMMTGAYGKQGEVEDEERALFESLLPTEEGGTQYELLSVARQVVSGMNYRFHVKMIEDGKESEAYVVIYEPLPGSGKEPSVTGIEAIPAK